MPLRYGSAQTTPLPSRPASPSSAPANAAASDVAPTGSVHTATPSTGSSSKASLVVLVHGLWGTPEHLQAVEDGLLQGNPVEEDTELYVLNAEGNEDERTYDGIDFCAARVVQEIEKTLEVIEKDGKQLVSLSMVGYSLGGLVARYVIGILHRKGFFETVRPLNFATFASPAIGMPRYRTWFSSLSSNIGSRLLSRTGAQLYNADEDRLIWRLADPTDVFMQALQLFPQIKVFANTVRDRTVPFPTGAFSLEDPFEDFETSGLIVETLEGLPVVTSYHLPSSSSSASSDEPARPWYTPWRRSSSSESTPKRKKQSSLPPFLRFQFPLNILFILSLPIVMPVMLGLILVRFARQSRRSRLRLKDEEASDIWDRLKALESKLEAAAADALGGGGGGGGGAGEGGSDGEPLRGSSLRESKERRKKGVRSSIKVKKGGLVLTEDQLEMIRNLGAVPQLDKVLVHFPDVFNSHAVIISRDTKRFPDHGQGKVLIKHWVDGMRRA